VRHIERSVLIWCARQVFVDLILSGSNFSRNPRRFFSAAERLNQFQLKKYAEDAEFKIGWVVS
jgi:hypothetical protein